MFADLIKELRTKQRVPQSQLAKAIGVSPGNVSDWESGRAKPGYAALAALSRFFGVSADYLLELDTSPVKTEPDLTTYKEEQGLSCDGLPLSEDEVDLVAMYRLLPEDQREDVFDLVHLKYQKHVERKKGSIFWTYTGDNNGGPAQGETPNGTA